jgi:hypothetical protein
MSKDKGIALRPLNTWKDTAGWFWAQARYRPNLQILPFFSKLGRACRALDLELPIKSLGKATARPSTFSHFENFLEANICPPTQETHRCVQ